MSEKLNAFGAAALKPRDYFVTGLGNFGYQLSWAMVGTYLAIFYTDVAGLGVGAVALLMLIARIWDGINDPIMGAAMERTHTRWGRFRPYIFIGAPLVVLFSILTFTTVPGFSGPMKLAFAYFTYIGLGMVYTVSNVPYLALPLAMTRDPNEINRLYSAQMIGMSLGQIFLNLCVLKMVEWFGRGNQADGYFSTVVVLSLIALPMFLAVAVFCKEKITVPKEKVGTVLDGFKQLARNKNLLCSLLYSFFNLFGIMGRISVAVFFYIHCVKNFAFITLFMMMQMLVGTLVMPFAPKVCAKLGKRNTAILSMIVQGGSLIILFLGPYENISFDLAMLIILGAGYIAGPVGSAMIVDAVDDFDDKYGLRNDGMAFTFQATATKIATAVATSLLLLVMGAYGYEGGVEMTPRIQFGINMAVNMVPGIVFFLGIIPLLIYDLDKKGRMEGVRARLAERDKNGKATPVNAS